MIPDKADPERDSVAIRWTESGGKVVRLGKFWDPPPELKNQTVRVYGNEVFCQVLAQKLGIILVLPDDEVLRTIPKEFLKRDIKIKSLNDFADLEFPLFIKSLVPKLIPSRVYTDLSEFQDQTKHLLSQERYLTANPINIVAEARAFIVHSHVLDISLYEGNADLSEAREFLLKFLASEARTCLPATFVTDLAYTKDAGWCVLEFNASCAAGLNDCSPQEILLAIVAGSGPR